MLDDSVDDFVSTLIDRFSPEELLEILGVSTRDLIDKFYDEILEISWEDYL